MHNRSLRSRSLAVVYPVVAAASVIAVLLSAPLARAEKVTEAAISRTCEIQAAIPRPSEHLDAIELTPSSIDMQVGQQPVFTATGADHEMSPPETRRSVIDGGRNASMARRRLTFTFDLLDAAGNKVRRLGRKKSRTDGGFANASIDVPGSSLQDGETIRLTVKRKGGGPIPAGTKIDLTLALRLAG